MVSLESIANSVTGAPSKIPSFSFHKVKAHAGIKGNERADKLANIGQIETCAVGRYLTILENPFYSAFYSFFETYRGQKFPFPT